MEALVRFQHPELLKGIRTEVIRLDEEPVSKTGGGAAPFVSSSPGTTAAVVGFRCVSSDRAHRPTGGRRLRTPEIRAHIPVGPFIVPWSNGDDSWLTSRQRWFNSTRDYLRPGTPMAERFGLNPSGCRFKSCSGHMAR